jgi:MinD-like ATPase involved in chromosome partitioning or flagellar assembly
MEIRVGGDQGIPVVVSAPNSPATQVFVQIAVSMRKRLE